MSAATSRHLRATVLVNPAARGVSATFNGSKIVRYLAANGVEASLLLPSSPAQATAEARASAARGDDLLFVIGGDGSVRDAALGLSGSETALAAVPAGTVNIWAKEAGIPSSIRGAIDAHIAGQSVHMDLGRANEHCFLLMAGVGWDAEVARRVPKGFKKLAGDLAYMAQAAWLAPTLRSRTVRWRAAAGTTEERLAWMVLSNSRLYGGRLKLTPDAIIDDGELDGLALCPTSALDTARLAAKVATGRLEDSRLISFRTPCLEVETPGLPVQLDGDYVGRTPMTFSVEESALLVSVPAGPLTPIFSREHIDRRRF
jgi:YegS/Rv2252/BmrU family lipid kinase